MYAFLLFLDILNFIIFLSYDKIYMIGVEINQLISEDESNEYIKKMKELSLNVKDFNKSLAQSLLSEGIIDYMYAAKMTDNMSFRNSHYRNK